MAGNGGWHFVATTAGLLLLVLVNMSSQQQPSPDLVVEVFEETPSNTYITDVPGAAKLDERYPPEVLETLRYSISTGNSDASNYFSCDQVSGVLRTKEKIDREEICPREVLCQIKVDIVVQPGQYFEIIKFTVTVVDTNDYKPTFLDSHITRSIPEDSRLDSGVSIPAADDLDSPRFGVKSYELVSGEPTFQLDVVNTSDGDVDLRLKLRQALDRETRELYRAVVIATDGGVTPNSGTLTIDVIVTDVNDNEPIFEEVNYRVSMPENTPVDAVVTQVRANDADSGSNGDVIYSFDSKTAHAHHDLFTINNETGEIILTSPLDYETKNVYNLGVIAKDKSQQSLPVSAKVLVQVSDVNDNAPEIFVNTLTSSGHVEILEGQSIGTFVAHMAVSDPDSGQSGQVICELTSPDFTVQRLFESEYKVVTAKVLDRETQGRYNLTFGCRDMGTPELSSSVSIALTVVDANDNIPKFAKQTYSVMLDENNDIGVFLTQLSATDPDLGPNGRVEYRAQGSAANYLHVDPMSGNVTAKVSFDYESVPNMEFVIEAMDHGAPALSSTATLRVSLRDIDDELPVFSTEHYNFQVYEQKPLGEEVGRVIAQDHDSAPFNEFVYVIDPSNVEINQLFIIDPQSGRLYTRRTLDREHISHYDFRIMAVAKNTPDMSSTVQVTVYVADKNDHAPVITFPRPDNNTVYVISNARIRDVITRVMSSDQDIGINGQLTYSILDGNNQQLFILDNKTGLVLLNKSLDGFENVGFQLAISVSDNGYPPLSASTILNIVVNKSTEASGMTSQNLTIVVSVVTVSSILVVVLILAIIVVRRQDSDKRAPHAKLAQQNVKAHVIAVSSQNAQAAKTEPLKLSPVNGAIPNNCHPIVGYTNQLTMVDENRKQMPNKSNGGPNDEVTPGTRVTRAGSRARNPSRPPPPSTGPSLDCHALACEAVQPGPTKPSSHQTNHHLHILSNHPSSSSQHQQHSPLRYNVMQIRPGAQGHKETDTESSTSSSPSNCDSGHGSNEDNESAEQNNLSRSRDEVILQPSGPAATSSPLKPTIKMPSGRKPPPSAPGGPPTNHSHSHNYAVHSSSPYNSNQSLSHKHLPPELPRKLPPKPPTLPHKPSLAHHRLSKDSTSAPRVHFTGLHGNMDSSWAEEDSDPEWSDEDKEYVYYVNASQV